MRKIIDGKVYDTATAAKVAENWNGIGSNDFNYLNEEIYKTKKGKFFLFGEGGAATKYATHSGQWSNEGEDLTPLSEGEVKELLEDWKEVDKYEELFGAPEEA